jgi:hypothetical protein
MLSGPAPASPVLAPGPMGLPRIVRTAALALAAMTLVWWGLAAVTGQWIHDPAGQGVPTDFVNVYAAGVMALDGRAPLAWDWVAQKAVEEAALGRAFDGYFGWHYPPPYLFVAETLARLPYGVAFIGWVLASFALFAGVMRRLAGHPIGWLLACAWPLALHNILIGQNGFLTAALIGAAALLLPARPWLAGVAIGLLLYKPQYGLLFPLALLAGGHWRSIAAATLTVVALVAASTLAFGVESWTAFFTWLPRASHSFLEAGQAEFGRLQSALALVRYAGGGDALAKAVQAAVSLGAAAVTVHVWRGRAAPPLKMAVLAAAVPLATPYLYPYDLMVLAVPVVLLLRIGGTDGFRRGDLALLGGATLLLALYPFVVAPVGPFAAAMIGWVALRRALAAPLAAPGLQAAPA